MDSLVQTIHKNSISGRQSDLDKLKKKLDDNTKALKRGAGKAYGALETLDVKQHTLGYCYILAAKATHTEIKDHRRFIAFSCVLLANGDAHQMRMATAQVSAVAIKYAESLIITESAIKGVFPLRQAVEKISARDPHLLTPAHTAFTLISLKAKVYDYALPVISRPIYSVDPSGTGLTPLDFLSYFYYAGMLYVGLKQYANAVATFELAFSAETKALSKVQVETYKKLILVNLILTGKAYSLPSSNQLGTGMKPKLAALCAAYTTLGDAFKYGPEAINKVANESGEIFFNDDNLGLVKQAISSHDRRRLRKLTDTYVTLSLDDMATRANLKNAKQAEKYVLGMIQDGDIYAKLDQKGGMLSFEEDPEQYDTKAMALTLNDKIQEMFKLSQKLKVIHKDVAVSKEFVKRTMPKDINEEAESDPLLRAALEASKRDS